RRLESRKKIRCSELLVLSGEGVLIRSLFESINESQGVARVFLRSREDMRSVIVELNRPDRKVGIQVIIHAAAQRPGRASIAGADVSAEMRDANQSMNKKVQLIRSGG